MSAFETLMAALAWLSLLFFAILALQYTWFTLVAWRRLAPSGARAPTRRWTRSSPRRSRRACRCSCRPTTRRAGIVASAMSLLDLRYPRHEVIVVNDGSTDETLQRLQEAFDLVPVREALRSRIPAKPLQGAYVSRRHRNLWVIDKENGGKSDALNAGINAARYPYYCAVDADAILENDALLRIVKPVIDDPDVLVAAAGIVRLANGARSSAGGWSSSTSRATGWR
jgi:hypothetical protein